MIVAVFAFVCGFVFAEILDLSLAKKENEEPKGCQFPDCERILRK